MLTKTTAPAALFALLLIAAAGFARADTLVREFKGNDDTVTTAFTVEGPWLLDWRLDADYDQLMALDVWLVDAETGFAVGRVLEKKYRSNGVKLFEDGGRYKFRVSTTLGRWTLKVRQLSPEEAEAYTPKRRPGLSIN